MEPINSLPKLEEMQEIFSIETERETLMKQWFFFFYRLDNQSGSDGQKIVKWFLDNLKSHLQSVRNSQPNTSTLLYYRNIIQKLDMQDDINVFNKNLSLDEIFQNEGDFEVKKANRDMLIQFLKSPADKLQELISIVNEAFRLYLRHRLSTIDSFFSYNKESIQREDLVRILLEQSFLNDIFQPPTNYSILEPFLLRLIQSPSMTFATEISQNHTGKVAEIVHWKPTIKALGAINRLSSQYADYKGKIVAIKNDRIRLLSLDPETYGQDLELSLVGANWIMIYEDELAGKKTIES